MSWGRSADDVHPISTHSLFPYFETYSILALNYLSDSDICEQKLVLFLPHNK